MAARPVSSFAHRWRGAVILARASRRARCLASLGTLRLRRSPARSLPRHAPLHHAAHECIDNRADPGALAPDPDPGLPLASLAALVQALLRSPPALRPALPRAVRSAMPAAQAPRRLRSAVFAGVDLPILHASRIGHLTRRAGLGFHTRRSRLLVCACALLRRPPGPFFPIWRLLAPACCWTECMLWKQVLSPLIVLLFFGRSSRSIRPFAPEHTREFPEPTPRSPGHLTSAARASARLRIVPLPRSGSVEANRSLAPLQIRFRFRREPTLPSNRSRLPRAGSTMTSASRQYPCQRRRAGFACCHGQFAPRPRPAKVLAGQGHALRRPLRWLARGPRRRAAMSSINIRARLSSMSSGSYGPPYQSILDVWSS